MLSIFVSNLLIFKYLSYLTIIWNTNFNDVKCKNFIIEG